MRDTPELTATLRKIELILRNGLPTPDAAAANVIFHALTEVEQSLESFDLPEWWYE